MNNPTLICQNEQRRYQVRATPNLAGLDYLEVCEDCHTLNVYFLGKAPEHDAIAKDNIRIEGGKRICDIRVVDVEICYLQDPELDDYMRVVVDCSGDFSSYTLRLVEWDEDGNLKPLSGFDPRYAQLQFSFQIPETSDIDCMTVEAFCPPEESIQPEIDYLAKDYASFRQLILERLALIMPEWQERHVPDLGITLVEILAYVGDYLSYYQDAVATEAYLETARQRISVRRHVRLVDYPMHEGCNARTWVWLETSDDYSLEDPKGFYFITSYRNAPVLSTILNVTDHLVEVPGNSYEVFEPITKLPIPLYFAHNQISFYTWGDRECCLPRGAIKATLVDGWMSASKRKLHLKIGDILIFEEVKGAKTGNVADADPIHRHAVRLTHVLMGEDTLYNQPIVEIEWAIEDALPFSLCISAIGQTPNCQMIEDISVARGNVILVDHGRTIQPEELGIVPEKEAKASCEAEGEPAEIQVVPGRFYPSLFTTPLTFSQPLTEKDLTTASATNLLTQDSRKALPQILDLIGSITLSSGNVEQSKWTPQRDLIYSNSQDQHFVVEMDNEGRAHLRFGDGESGQMPVARTRFQATYRVGNGPSGNLAAETISYIVFPNTLITGLTIKPHQLLPAKGGTSPEPLSEVKLFAPHSFHQELQRAITENDYAELVMRDFPTKVQRAAATLRWTGSWYEVVVVIDPSQLVKVDDKLLQEITTRLYLYRRIGHEVVVKGVVEVALDVAMTVYVKCDYQRGYVKAVLLDIFSNRILPNNRRGFFHPDNFTFGQGIALSQLVAIAQAVPGVESVNLTKLERLFQGPHQEIEKGFLPISPLEKARLDNDPKMPENGKFTLDMRGGR